MTTDPPFDVVMVGFHRDFDYEEMRRAATAVRTGARLIATNDDATYPTPDGPIPGGGSIVAGIATAGGADAVVAGKPYPPMAGLVRHITGLDDLREAIMVGDRPDTDGRMATTLQCRYAHVRSGVTPAGTVVTPQPFIEAENLAAVADLLLDGQPDGRVEQRSHGSYAGRMAQNVVRRLLDSGIQFTEESQARAEAMVKELVKAGDIRRKDAEATVQALIGRGRQTSEHLRSTIRSEVAKQMSRFAERMDDVEDRLEDHADKLGLEVRAPRDPTDTGFADEVAVADPPTPDGPDRPVKTTAPKKVAPKKAASKKAVPPKAPSKKAAPAKAASKKVAPAKAAPRKQARESPGPAPEAGPAAPFSDDPETS